MDNIAGFKGRTSARKAPSMWVIVSGGLGNQMFQAAFALALAEKFRAKPRFLDFTATARASRMWSLEKFGLKAERFPPLIATILQSTSAPRLAPYFAPITVFAKISELGIALPSSFLVQRSTACFPRVSRKPRVVSGYWQSPQYFEDHAEVVRCTFALPGLADATMIHAVGAAKPTVAIHVRRGDYAADVVTRNKHLICTEEWYRNAWREMLFRLPTAHAFVFSEDPRWCRETLALEGEVTYVPYASAAHPAHDMSLMAACQHFIISNSSYSWWAAWLGSAPGKTVIAPREWFRGQATAGLRICPPDWILL